MVELQSLHVEQPWKRNREQWQVCVRPTFGSWRPVCDSRMLTVLLLEKVLRCPPSVSMGHVPVPQADIKSVRVPPQRPYSHVLPKAGEDRLVVVDDDASQSRETVCDPNIDDGNDGLIEDT